MPASQKGFTLVELLVVISIIAILSTIGMVVFTGVQKSARDARRKGDIEAIAKAYEVTYNSTGSYRALTDADFASGLPKDPSKGDYFNVRDTGNQGFKVCAALDNNPFTFCNTSATNCYCQSSSQGSIPAGSQLAAINDNTTFIAAGLGGSSSPSCDPNGTLSAGLAGYWKFDEITNNAVVDSSGRGNNGSLSAVGVANPSLVPGVSNNGLLFTHTLGFNYDKYNMVQIGNSSSLAIGTGDFTISMWVYPTTQQGGNDYALLIERNGGFNGYMIRWSDGKFYVLIGNGSSDYWVNKTATNNGGGSFPINTWYHVVLTLERNGDQKVYINNTNRASQRISNSSSLGGSSNVVIGKIFNGYIDDARIYNRALSPTEVTTLYGVNGGGCFPN